MVAPIPHEYVLLVDDDWSNLEVLEAYLELEGILSTLATSAEQALKIMEKVLPSLIICDMRMPGVSGLDFCRQLKANPATQHIPIAIITGLERDSDIIDALEAGADDFITKPYHAKLLMARVKTLMKITRLHYALNAALAELKRQQ
ncbi:MAG: hypothetical protein CUN55_03340 [Phototrophicales bacterium]|nr:MAG: hypothetical protein CUN55_03340 [Phototrophicales bacterium]